MKPAQGPPAQSPEPSSARGWWAPPPDELSRSFAAGGMPRSLPGFVWTVSARSQMWLALLAVAVFALNTAPLELQRRMLNAMVVGGQLELLLGLAVLYALVVLAEGLVKLTMNVYRGWVGEKAVRTLRLTTSAIVHGRPVSAGRVDVQGVGISLLLAEPEPLGAFAGIAVSELVLQIGILVSVFGYMFYIEPLLAFVSLAVFSPQLLFVPLMQRAINRRVRARIAVLREASVGMLESSARDEERRLRQELRFAEIFRLNLGIYELKYSMNFLMNLVQNVGKVTILAVGGWYVIEGRTEVGTVVAFVSGFHNLADPWGDLVHWFQDMTLNDAKYRSFVAAIETLRDEIPAGRP